MFATLVTSVLIPAVVPIFAITPLPFKFAMFAITPEAFRFAMFATLVVVPKLPIAVMFADVDKLLMLVALLFTADTAEDIVFTPVTSEAIAFTPDIAVGIAPKAVISVFNPANVFTLVIFAPVRFTFAIDPDTVPMLEITLDPFKFAI